MARMTSKKKKKQSTTKTCFDTWLEKFDWKQAIPADIIYYWDLEVKFQVKRSKFSLGNYLKIILDVHFFITFFLVEAEQYSTYWQNEKL